MFALECNYEWVTKGTSMSKRPRESSSSKNAPLTPDPSDPRLFDLHSQFCRVFADPKRLQILWCLKSGERSVGEVATALALPLSNISQHLRVMRDRGAVRTRRDGRNIYYRIANQKFVEGAALVREGLLEELATRRQIGSGGHDERE